MCNLLTFGTVNEISHVFSNVEEDAAYVGEDTKTGDKPIKSKFATDFRSSVPGAIDATESNNYVQILEKSKFSKKTATLKFQPIKKKQWKPFNADSSGNDELNENRNKKITVEEQPKNSTAQNTDQQNYNELLEKNAKGQPKAQEPVTSRKVSKSKRQYFHTWD